MSMFTRVEMNRHMHILNSGKSIADKDHHMVPTSLLKPNDSWMTNISRKFSVRVTKGIFISKASAAIAFGRMTHHIL